MPLETGEFINDLVRTNPPVGDQVAQGDDHLRLLKTVLQGTFPSANKAFQFPRFDLRLVDTTSSRTDQNKFYSMSAAGGAVTLTLPDDLTADDDGWSLLVNKADSTSDPVHIVPASGTINGLSGIDLLVRWDAALLVWSGSDWRAAFTRASVTLPDIPAGLITNSKLADMVEARVKGRPAGTGTGAPSDMTGTQTTALLNVFDVSLKGLAPASAANDGVNGKVLLASGSWGYDGAPHASFADQKTQNTDGGTFTSGSFLTRTLQTTYRNRNSFATLASNQISLPAGDYYLTWSAPAYQAGRHQSRIYNVTGSITGAYGTVEVSGNGDATQTRSTGKLFITLAGTTLLELQHQCANTANTTGFGLAGNFATEVYSIVDIWRM